MTDNLIIALKITGLGMGIVFAILIVIYLAFSYVYFYYVRDNKYNFIYHFILIL